MDGYRIAIESKLIQPENTYEFWKFDSLVQGVSVDGLPELVWSRREYNRDSGITLEENYIFTRVFNGVVPLDLWDSWKGNTITSTTWKPGAGVPLSGTTNWFYSNGSYPLMSRDSVPFSQGSYVAFSPDWKTRYTVSAQSTRRLVNTSENTVWVWRNWFETAPNSGFTGTQICVSPGGSSIFSPVLSNSSKTFSYVYSVDQWNSFLSTCPPWEAP